MLYVLKTSRYKMFARDSSSLKMTPFLIWKRLPKRPFQRPLSKRQFQPVIFRHYQHPMRNQLCRSLLLPHCPSIQTRKIPTHNNRHQDLPIHRPPIKHQLLPEMRILKIPFQRIQMSRTLITTPAVPTDLALPNSNATIVRHWRWVTRTMVGPMLGLGMTFIGMSLMMTEDLARGKAFWGHDNPNETCVTALGNNRLLMYDRAALHAMNTIKFDRWYVERSYGYCCCCCVLLVLAYFVLQSLPDAYYLSIFWYSARRF